MLKSAASAWVISTNCIADCLTEGAPPSLTLIWMRCKLCRHSGRPTVRCAASLPAASIFQSLRRRIRLWPIWKTNCVSWPEITWSACSFC